MRKKKTILSIQRKLNIIFYELFLNAAIQFNTYVKHNSMSLPNIEKKCIFPSERDETRENDNVTQTNIPILKTIIG